MFSLIWIGPYYVPTKVVTNHYSKIRNQVYDIYVYVDACLKLESTTCKKINWIPNYKWIFHWKCQKVGYRFYCPCHTTRIVESSNVKFIEYSISGSDLSRDIVPEHNPFTTSGERLIIIHNLPRVQIGIKQPINENSQIVEDVVVDRTQEMIEQHIHRKILFQS